MPFTSFQWYMYSEFKNIIHTVFFYGIVFFMLFCSCSKEDAADTDDVFETVTVPTILPDGSEKYLNQNSDFLFDQEKLHSFKLIIPKASYARINSDPAKEEYVDGMLIFEGDTISPVGIKYKGSVGAFVNCLSGPDWSNPSGYKTCTKLSMKVKVNWKGRDDKFYKLNKLQFHSQNLDPSQMHERLGYYLFREMGVPAPRSVHARLIINDQYLGVFALTEQIDGRFSRYHFQNVDGNLFKEVWPLNDQGQIYPDIVYKNALRTNEDKNPSVALIREFGKAIRDAPENKFKEVVSQYMDIDKIIAFVVVDRMIRNDDGPFHWYCNGNGCGNHNYFWYEDPLEEKLHLIPWDLDNAFENIITNNNPVTPIADSWGQTRNNCDPFRYESFNSMQKSAACDKLTKAWTLFEDEYHLMKAHMIQTIMEQSFIENVIDKWVDQIKASTLEAADLHQDALSMAKWEWEVQYLKDQLEFARNN